MTKNYPQSLPNKGLNEKKKTNNDSYQNSNINEIIIYKILRKSDLGLIRNPTLLPLTKVPKF